MPESLEQFGDRIKTKYPDYADMDSIELANRMLAKYPEYKEQVDMSSSEKGSILGSAAEDIWQGVKGVVTAPIGLYNLGKQVGGAIGAGDMGKLGEIGKGIVMPTVERAKAIGRPIMEQGVGGIPEAAEEVARKPFSYAMDAATLTAPFKATRGFSQAIDPGVMAIKGIGKGIELGNKAIGATTKMGASLAFGPSRQAITARIQSPESVRNAMRAEDLAQTVPQTFPKIDVAIKEASEKAWSNLSDVADPRLGAIPTEDIVKSVSGIKEAMGAMVGPADKKAVSLLNEITSDIVTPYQKITPETVSPILTETGQPRITPQTVQQGSIPQTKIKEIIQKIDSNLDWGDTTAGTANAKLKQLRFMLDKHLKDTSPQYAKDMENVARLVTTKSKGMEALGVEEVKRGQYAPAGDVTISKIKNLPKDTKDISRKAVEALGMVTGDDYAKAADFARWQAEFERASTAGSRRTLMGTLAGTLVGEPTLGAVAGYAADVQGGRFLGKVIDTTAPAIKAVDKAVETTGRTISGMPITYTGPYSKAAFYTAQNEKEQELMRKYREQK